MKCLFSTSEHVEKIEGSALKIERGESALLVLPATSVAMAVKVFDLGGNAEAVKLNSQLPSPLTVSGLPTFKPVH